MLGDGHKGLEKHPDRSIGSGELQVDNSVEDILVKETHMKNPPKSVRKGILICSFLAVMEVITNIPTFAAKKDS